MGYPTGRYSKHFEKSTKRKRDADEAAQRTRTDLFLTLLVPENMVTRHTDDHDDETTDGNVDAFPLVFGEDDSSPPDPPASFHQQQQAPDQNQQQGDVDDNDDNHSTSTSTCGSSTLSQGSQGTNSSVVSTESTTASSNTSSENTTSINDDNTNVNTTGTQFLPQNLLPQRPNINESCSFELLRLIDGAGAPRYLYDQVKTLLVKQSKKGLQLHKAHSRDKIMEALNKRFPCPAIQECNVNGQKVYKFSFIDMLQDLVTSCSDDIHIIQPPDTTAESPFPNEDLLKNKFIKSELWNTTWMQKTFKHCETYKNFNPRQDIMLPLILYMDKTGTDTLQRYSLEPVLFTTASIPREAREKSSSWRNLGFLPCISNEIEGQEKSSNNRLTQNQLQLYHDCLGAILQDLISAQKNPPFIDITKNGVNLRLKARLPVIIVMGDQKSQDTLCGRKHANSGGAGRIHRSCMCSYMTVDDGTYNCIDVCAKTIKDLTHAALTSNTYRERIALQYSRSSNNMRSKDREKHQKVIANYLTRQKRMNSQILQFPFTQHAIRNAFDDVDFGSWSSGIFTATFDDFMHSTESGLFEYTSELVFGGMTEKERKLLETKIIAFLLPCRSSVRSSFPRWRLKDGFSRLTLMTCGEKVGSIFMLALALQDQSISDQIHQAHHRQRLKYISFSPQGTKPKDEDMDEGGTDKSSGEENNSMSRSKKKRNISNKESASSLPSTIPFYWEKHIPKKNHLLPSEIEERLVSMARHGFDLNILRTLDHFQIYSLIHHHDIGVNPFPASFPKCNIPGHYKNLGLAFKIPNTLLLKAVDAYTLCSPKNPSCFLKQCRFIPVENTIQKHYKRKSPHKGVGATSAILTDDICLFHYFMEYLLCFHAFCRYSFTLPNELQDKLELLDFSSRSLVQYFEKLVYRGDKSVDSRTPKVHANKRVGYNYKALGSCMHADCQTGERLLKTKAKSASSTAQQRGNSIFEHQTMKRIQEEVTMSRYEKYLEQEKLNSGKKVQMSLDAQSGKNVKPNVTRHIPNFRYCPLRQQWLQLDRKGKEIGFANINRKISKALFVLEPNLDVYEMYSEVQLSDKSRIRATPKYCKNSGPWYDFVTVKWENPPCLYPARCLGFYKKKVTPTAMHNNTNNNENTSTATEEVMVLVHGADIATSNHPKSYNNKDTLLTMNYLLEYDARTKEPKIYTVSIDSIDTGALCFLRDPPTDELVLFPEWNSNGIVHVRPRNEWAYVWIAWNEVLQESNSPARLSKRKKYVNIGSEQIIRQVKKKILEYLERSPNQNEDTEGDIDDGSRF